MYTAAELEELERQHRESRTEQPVNLNNKGNKANNLIDCTNHAPIGHGAFGYVIKCIGYDQYVVKYIKKARTINTTNKVKDAVKRREEALIRERDLMLMLNNDHIVKAFDKKVKISKWDVVPDYAYMVLEYCNGGDLRNILRYNYNVGDILNKFVYGIGSALQYIHEQDIIHHDLKPENVFVSIANKNDITLKLGDFGLYSKIDDLYKSSIEGTDFYLPWYQLVSTEKAQMTNIYYNRNPIQFVNTNLSYVPVAKYFIDWYAYVCIIYEIITTEKLNVILAGNNLNVFNTCSIDLNRIPDTTLRNILMNIMCIDITVYFTGIDDLTNEYYQKLFNLLATQEYIYEPIISKKDIRKDGKKEGAKALEYDSGNKNYKLTLPRNNKKIIISSPEQIMSKLYSSEKKIMKTL